MRTNSKSGFTIIEISMIILAMSLLIGGIFMGRALVDAAKLREVIQKLNKFEVGRASFKQKFSCTPGDCRNAADFGLGTNGDGDGYVTDMKTNKGSLPRKEILEYWVHLDNAGLLGEDYSRTPLTGPRLQNGGPATGMHDAHFSIGYERSPIKQYYFIGVNASSKPAYRNIDRRFIPREIESIDKKIDDGAPLDGLIEGYYGLKISNSGAVSPQLPPSGGTLSSGGSLPATPECSLTAYDYNLATETPSCVAKVEFRKTMQ
jgi:hypothetical protein